MNALFLDCDGVLYDDYMAELYRRADFGRKTKDRDIKELIDTKRILMVCDWAKETNTNVVISSLTCDKRRYEYIKEIMSQKGLEPIGKIKCIRRRTSSNCYNDAWKEYGISDFLSKNLSIDHIAIIDDEIIDLHTFEDYVSLVDNQIYLSDEDEKKYYTDSEYRKLICSKQQGLQQKHLEEATKILKKDYIYRGKQWK